LKIIPIGSEVDGGGSLLLFILLGVEQKYFKKVKNFGVFGKYSLG
jgi:hypothetical protein